MALLETQTPRGSRYYANGRRVTRAAMRSIKDDAERLDSFWTRIAGETVRHGCSAMESAR